MPYDLSIIIVNWNTRDDLARCLASLVPACSRLATEVVVVDNGSRDGSARLVRRDYPWVRLIATGRNLGFARGNNVGLAQATGRFRLLLNPDTIVHDDALEQLVRYANANPEVGLLGPMLLNRDGSLQPSCRRFPTVSALLFRNTPLERWLPNNRFARSYLMEEWNHRGPREVDWLSGACLLARAELVEALGGLDERYFMYVEDMDLGLLAHRAGWRVVYLPSARVTHAVGRSSDQQPAAMVKAHHRSMYLYVRKHYGVAAALLASPLLALRCWVMLQRAKPSL
ncbi:MAG: glycosyltransferase family 2 protein [Armatimonadetes bacterium]|nr:glycosyltransferase family 2 protein [Armatimonadota bacterium]